MNRQVGNRCDRHLEVDQLALDATITAVGDTAGQRQIAVEPGGEQGAAIHLDTQLPEALALQLRLRLDPQARTVGMGADQPQTMLDERLAAQLKGDDGRVIAGDVITPTSLGMPDLTLVQRTVAGGL